VSQNSVQTGTAAAAKRSTGDEPAVWISGAQWAYELDVDPTSGIGEVCGPETWNEVRRFALKYDVEINYHGTDGMAFKDFPAIPCNTVDTVEVTRRQVAEFANDTLTDDPHEIGNMLSAARFEKFRKCDRINRALKEIRIPVEQLYTLDAVDAGAGAEIAETIREAIDRHNRRAWNTPKPHRLVEKPHLVTAGELVGQYGIEAAVLGTLIPATDADLDVAHSRLDVARRRHHFDQTQRAKGDESHQDDGPLYADIGQLLDVGLPDPPVPDLLRRSDGVGLFYRGEINAVYGDPEDGKTMLVLAGAAQVLCDNGTVLFVDLDNNGLESIVARLVMFGAPKESLHEGRFRYCYPSGADRLEEVVADSLRDGRVPDMAVFDCVGELIPMFGGSNDDADDFTRVMRATAGPLAHAGSGVVLIDHMAKNTQSRNYGAGGTMAKRRRIGGTQLRVFVDVPLRKGHGGSLSIGVHKDRHGGLRQHCAPAIYDRQDKQQRMQPAGTFILDPGDAAWCVAVDPFTPSAAEKPKNHRYSDAAGSLEDGWTITDLAKRVHGDKPTDTERKATSRAVADLIKSKIVEEITPREGQRTPATHRLRIM